MSFLINPYVFAGFANSYSFLFDGVDEYCNVSDDASLDITDNFSVTAWIYTGSNNEAFASKWFTTGNQRSWFFGTDTSGKLRGIVCSNGSSTIRDYRSTTSVNDSAWHFVCMTFASGTYKLYVDGSEETVTKSSDGAVNSIFSGSANLHIGNIENAGFFEWTGYIDEVAIWDTTVLSGADISTLYNSGVPTDLSEYAGSANLVSWWRMGEGATWGGANWTIPDEVGSNTATSANMEEADRNTSVPS